MAHPPPEPASAPDEPVASAQPTHLYGVLIFGGVVGLVLLTFFAHFYYFYSLRK